MKNVFKNKRNILMIMFALVVIMGIGFAAYSQQLKISDTSSIDSDWNVYIKKAVAGTKEGGATGNAIVNSKTEATLTTDLKYPGDYVVYTITVANDGTIDAALEKIDLKPEKENTVIKYSYILKNGTETTDNETMRKEIEELNVNDIKEFSIKVAYDSTMTGTATDDQKSNKLTLTLDYVQKGTSSENPAVPSNPVIDMNGVNVQTVSEGDGLYPDEYEAGRYVYKGTNPDNYITFNDEVSNWRILSVESDNSLKIINKDNSFGYKMWDTNIDNNWGRPATLNTFLNDENDINSYYNMLNNDSKLLIQSHNFNIGAVVANNDSLENQILSEESEKWNGKIGLITVGEFLKANSNTNDCENYKLNNINYDICKPTNYLVPTEGTIWTITPSTIDKNRVFRISNTNMIQNFLTNNGYHAVKPTLYLKSNITLSGSGTETDPYTIN